MDFYERYLVGQTNGFSDSLNLEAVRCAMEIEEVPKRERPEKARRLLLLHREIVACIPKGKS